MTFTFQQCKGILNEALLSKYPDLSNANLDEITNRTWDSAIATSTEVDLLTLLRPIQHYQDDINNQVIVLQVIDRFWSRETAIKKPLRQIHRALFGGLKIDQFRDTEFIRDYGGVVETPAIEILPRLDEIERLSRACINSYASAPLPTKALFLAYVFSAVIRIHPFIDGNGRTARMFVQFALRSWNLSAIEIPKVRNDVAWKKALVKAIQGNILDLQEQFIQRMTGSKDFRSQTTKCEK